MWRDRLVDILRRKGRLTEAQIEEALKIQGEKGGLLGEILVGMKAVSEPEVYEALGEQFGLPFVAELPHTDVDSDIVSKIPITYAKRFGLVPTGRRDGHVQIALSNPLSLEPLDDLRRILGEGVEPVLSTPKSVLGAINRVYDVGSDSAEQMMEDLNLNVGSLDTLAHELEEPEDLLDADTEAPIIRLVNTLLAQALKERASDIHIEPFEREMAVRFRVDGILHDILYPPKRFQNSIISRVKIMANMNIAEKRLPQDGRIRIKVGGKDIDIRISVIPVANGERIVMRLLDKSAVLLDLAQLGMWKDHLITSEGLIRRANGIVLVTGPTGCGKTTTLYAAITRINSPDKNIITIEDPIEYQIRGIGQIQVNDKVGLTFAGGLRSVLRQDPDVILVGEIRDTETAEIAIQASLTGHLVFSTLHTNDAPGAITRLVEMGVEPFLVSSSVVGVMAQRLVRMVCPTCKVAYRPTEEVLAEVGLKHEALEGGVLYQGKGCEACMNTGYRGRTGIYELLLMSEAVRTLILRNADSNAIRKTGMAEGMLVLRQDGARKIAAGMTTIEEVVRVTQDLL